MQLSYARPKHSTVCVFRNGFSNFKRLILLESPHIELTSSDVTSCRKERTSYEEEVFQNGMCMELGHEREIQGKVKMVSGQSVQI